MSDVRNASLFDANLPNLACPVRISSFFDAQMFVRRWAIRDKDPTVRIFLRRMEKANSAETANSAIEEARTSNERIVAQHGVADPLMVIPPERLIPLTPGLRKPSNCGEDDYLETPSTLMVGYPIID